MHKPFIPTKELQRLILQREIREARVELDTIVSDSNGVDNIEISVRVFEYLINIEKNNPEKLNEYNPQSNDYRHSLVRKVDGREYYFTTQSPVRPSFNPRVAREFH